MYIYIYIEFNRIIIIKGSHCINGNGKLKNSYEIKSNCNIIITSIFEGPARKIEKKRERFIHLLDVFVSAKVARGK